MIKIKTHLKNWKESSSVVRDRCQHMNADFSWKDQKCMQKVEYSAIVHRSLDEFFHLYVLGLFPLSQHHAMFQSQFSLTFTKCVLVHCDSRKSANKYQ